MDRSKFTNYKWHLHIPLFFCSQEWSKYYYVFLLFFSIVNRDSLIHLLLLLLLLLLFTPSEFFTSALADGFHWSLSDSKSPQVSRTLLSILAVLNNAVVWMVTTQPPTSKSSRPFNNPLVTVTKATISIGIIVTFMFHSFFQISSEVEVLILLFPLFQFYSVVSRDSKVDNSADFFFFFDYYTVWASSRD